MAGAHPSQEGREFIVEADASAAYWRHRPDNTLPPPDMMGAYMRNRPVPDRRVEGRKAWIIGSGIAANSYYGGYGYYGGSPYYGSSYGYYDDDAPDVVEVAPSTSGGDVDYCIRTYKSYNVRTGTYLGYDGQRHACP